MEQGIQISTTRIAVVGPESSGKSYVCERISEQTRASLVNEFAREYLSTSKTPYDLSDLILIAEEQFKRNREAIGPLVICDTEMITMTIWAKEKFGSVPERITELLNIQSFDRYLLCRPDIPWIFDPLRENPHDRDRLFEMYTEHLQRLGIEATLIAGSFEKRDATIASLSSHLR